MRPEKPLTYQDSGVDIRAADSFVERVAALARATHGATVVQHPSRYSGLLQPDLSGMRQPVLAATCDGVGTKLLVARDAGRFQDLGQDLVAMSVNDLVPLGARPLLFLDYIASGKLEPGPLTEIVAGIAAACKSVGCALIGGETAEMPGLYAPHDFDLAGFAVGIVDRERLPEAAAVSVGDVVLGLPSTGIHSNGLSLARAALFERGGMQLDEQVPELGCTLAEELLVPTALYVNPVLDLFTRFGFRAAAHITGGGLIGRGEKLLLAGQRMVLDRSSFVRPAIFDLIAERGRVTSAEMGRTFNLGLGFLVVMEPAAAARALAQCGAPWRQVGVIEAGEPGVQLVGVSP